MLTLLERRRELMAVRAVAPTPSAELIYELESPTSTQTYDTGVKPFETAQSFTILCEALFNNRNWTNNQSVFAIPTADGVASNFLRIGRTNTLNNYTNGELAESGKSYYTAFVCNNLDDDADKKKSHSLLARMTNTTAQTHRFAVRYDHTSLKCEGMSDTLSTWNAWWYLDAQPVSSLPIKLLAHSATGTINVFKVYRGLLTDTEISNFLQIT